MPEFRIGIEVGHLLPEKIELVPGLFPNLAHAVQQIAERAQTMWMGYAAGEPLPDGSTIQSRSGAYLRSIQLFQTDPLNAEVFSEAPHAKSIEEGAPARDLKKMLDTSMKVRQTRDGRRYLIIPFRWGTPGTTGFGKNVMPQQVHEMFGGPGGLKPSRVTGMGKRVSGTGAYDIKTRSPFKVDQRQYKWGGRLTVESLKAAGVRSTQAKRMAGMVNMQNPSGTTGGGKHSQFFTFRMMVEGSKGWLVPAQPGKFPARHTADRIRPIAERAFAAAVAADINQIVGGGA